MQNLVSSSAAKCVTNNRIIVWHKSPKSDLNDSLVCLGSVRQLKGRRKALLSPKLLCADAEELKSAVNFKLNLKHTHGPL